MDTHIYKDKFWCEVVTKNIDQVKDVIIYGQSLPDNLKNAVMGESDTLQLISLFSITVTQRSVGTQTLPIRISHVLIVKITCKVPHTFRMIPLIITFDRDRDYC